jgi:hypothetical protein
MARGVTRDDWSHFEPEDRYKIIGHDQWELLGNNTAAGRANTVFNRDTPEHLEIRKKIYQAIKKVVNADDDKVRAEALNFINTLRNIDGFNIGVATRLLALARPDRLITANGASGRFAKIIGITLNRLLQIPPEGYNRALKWLDKRQWYSSPQPRAVLG